jgi:hypothetical protein
MIIRDSSWRYIDASSFSDETSRALAKEGGMNPKHMEHVSVPMMENITKEDILRVEPMSLGAEICCMIFLACVGPTGVFTIPLITFLVGYFVVGNVTLAFQILAIILLPLMFYPQSFTPKALTSWMSHMILKYFSYRMLCTKGSKLYIQQDVGRLTKATENQRPQIFVAPPHGVL